MGTNRGPFESRTIAVADGCSVHDVRCHSERSAWSNTERSSAFGMVVGRAGCFRRRHEHGDDVVHAGMAYFEEPGLEQEFAHPHEKGDVCTVVAISRDLVLAVCDETNLPRTTVFVDTSIDLEHHRLLAACRRRDDFAAAEAIVSLFTSVLAKADAPRLSAGRPSTTDARRRLVEDAREVVAGDPTVTLTELARTLSISPHHLSRIFHDHAGEPLARYRNRLRVRLVLERLDRGETNLAQLATDLSFADHAHMTRVVRRETGTNPSSLRSALAASA